MAIENSILSMVDFEGSKRALRTTETTSPNIELELVAAEDIDEINYVSGSEGKYKTIIEKDGDGNVLKTTTLFYTISAFPTKVTSIQEV
jgi:hypothetical protein